MKDIIGYEGLYKIRRDGAVYSIGRPRKKGGWIKPRRGKHGYWYFVLCKNNDRKTFKVHRLVGLHFIENPNNYKYLNHIDSDKGNNNDWNLEWCTAQYNIQHSYKSGYACQQGFRNNHAKIKDIETLNAIKSEYKSGISQRIIACKYSVSQATISHIITGVSYGLIDAGLALDAKTIG
jgi:hypothetical protein